MSSSKQDGKEQKEREINEGTKVIDLISSLQEKKRRFVSFEYYPPKTEQGVVNLKKNLQAMIKWKPQWMDVTWGAGGVTSDLTPALCDYIQNDVKGNCMMHLTCTNMESKKIDIALKQAKNMGFKNILALRGDPPEGQKEWSAVQGGFECALDLVKYIRKVYGDYFGVTVSGYPEGHPNVRKKIEDASWDKEKNTDPKYYAVQQMNDGSYMGVSEEDWRKEIAYLKAKVEAGAQVIITQLFYDANTFLDWVKAVRASGVNAPILPGIMPIRSYGAFNRMTGFCKTIVPKALRQKLEELKADKDALYAFGLDYVHKMCETLLAAKDAQGQDVVPGLHIYTMNSPKCTIELLSKCKVGWIDDPQLKATVESELKRVLQEEQAKQLQKQKAATAAAQQNANAQSNTNSGTQGDFAVIASF